MINKILVIAMLVLPNIGIASIHSENIKENSVNNLELNEREIAQYKKISNGVYGSFVKDMPVLLVLAMFSENEKDLKRYAERLAVYEKTKVKKLLRAQKAYDDAMNRMYPNEKIIDLNNNKKISKITGGNEQHHPKIGEVIVGFTDKSCRSCIEKIKLIRNRYQNNKIEIFFRGSPGDFKEWVELGNEKINWYKNNNIVFSKDGGRMKQYNVGVGDFLVVRNKSLYEIDI